MAADGGGHIPDGLARLPGRRQRRRHARDAATNERPVGHLSRNVSRAGCGVAGGGAQALAADRRRHRDRRVCVHQRHVHRLALPAGILMLLAACVEDSARLRDLW